MSGIDVVLVDSSEAGSLHTVDSIVAAHHGRVLVTESQARSHGVWKTAQITTQTTTTVAAARPGDAIVITDVVISAKKVNNATADVQFSDGSNTEIFASPDMNTNPVNQAFSPQGFFGGWKDADIQVVTAGANPIITVLIGYYHISGALEFSQWDALR